MADGIRACTATSRRAKWPGYDGVHVFAPPGERIGQILLPEICANLCFGGAKRNRLFMAASQSLYALVYVETHGAHIARPISSKTSPSPPGSAAATALEAPPYPITPASRFRTDGDPHNSSPASRILDARSFATLRRS